jgi:hypothetical protein
MMRLGVFIPKISPNGRGFDSSSGQITIFHIKHTRNVKSMQNAVKSTCHKKIEYDYLHWFYVSKTWILRFRSLSEPCSLQTFSYASILRVRWTRGGLKLKIWTEMWSFFTNCQHLKISFEKLWVNGTVKMHSNLCPLCLPLSGFLRVDNLYSCNFNHISYPSIFGIRNKIKYITNTLENSSTQKKMCCIIARTKSNENTKNFFRSLNTARARPITETKWSIDNELYPEQQRETHHVFFWTLRLVLKIYIDCRTTRNYTKKSTHW